MGKKRDVEKTITTYHGALPEAQPWQPQRPPVYTGRRETPTLGTKEGDVVVPGLQAVLVAVAIGQAVGVVAMLVTLAFRWPWWLPLLAWAVSTSLLLAFKVTINIEDARRKMIPIIEAIMRADLDGDGHIGEPPSLTVEVVDHDRKMTKYVDLGIDGEKASIFARSVLAGRGLSLGEWTGRAGLLSRSEFETMRGKLLESGLIRWVNPDAKQQGCELTPAGKAVFQKLANHSPIIEGEAVCR